MKSEPSTLILFNSRMSDYVLLNLGLPSPLAGILALCFEYPSPINTCMQYYGGGRIKEKPWNIIVALFSIKNSQGS